MLSLQNVMRANAISCLSFGALFALLPSQVAIFLERSYPAPSLYILILGILLALHGLHLLWASRTPMPTKALVLYFSIGDFLWVLLSISLIISKTWIATNAGILTTSVVATIVGLLGILQLACSKMATNQNQNSKQTDS